MMRASKPTWRFPARSGGIDFVNDPSSTHFSDAPIPKLVRELLQNSLDARDDRFTNGVTVTFSEGSAKRELLAAEELQSHLKSCLDRAMTDQRTDTVALYTRALKVIQKSYIPFLKVQDIGTTGLQNSQWKALVVQEGAVSKGSGAPSGSYGIGKNAVLNVSDIQTVFYSTRYVEGRKGRVEKLQGKATLTGHPSPYRSKDDLQHIGFYANEDGSPIMGKAIPDFYRLHDTGTAVFIMGFNPHSGDWVSEVATAVIENFFYAIHNKHLRVDIVPKDEARLHIDYETIDMLFERLKPTNKDALHYYRTIRDLSPENIEYTSQLGELGQLRAYITFSEGAPRRIAHINLNGMLISDSREQKVNPLVPRGRSFWPDYVGVVVPDSDSGDLWLRRMENPSHDSVSTGQLFDESERREADRRLKDARKALSNIIDHKAEIPTFDDESNLDELAEMLPEQLDSQVGTRIFQTRLLDSPRPQVSMKTEPEVSGDDGGEGKDSIYSNSGSTGDRGEGESNNSPGESGKEQVKHHKRQPVLRCIRFIPLSAREVIVAFTPSTDPPEEVRLSLIPAGADRHPGGDPLRARSVPIVEATAIEGVNSPLRIDDGVITLIPKSTERVSIKVVSDSNLDQGAFKLQ